MPLSVFAAAAEAPDRTALVTEHGDISYADLARRTRRAVGWLRDRSLDGDAPVALVATNDLPTVEMLHALIALGTPALLAHPRLTAEERIGLVEAGGAALVPTDWRHDIDDTDDPEDGIAREKRPSGSHSGDPEAPPSDERPLAIVHTSGTSGRPRGVVLSRRAFAAAAAASAANLGWNDDDRWLLPLPLAHVGGLSILTRCLLARRAVVLTDDRTPEALLDTVRRHRVTLLSLVPTLLVRILDLEPTAPPPDHLRAVLLGGAGASPVLLDRATNAGWPALTTYGLTEACSQVTTQRYGTVSRGELGSGPPLPGTEVRIGAGDEIQLRGPTLFSGYLRAGRGPGPFLADGWFPTGDHGYLDDAGNLHVLGRRADRIVTGGENVDPMEVERALERLPGIRQACVFGIPDEEWGEVVCAAVVPDRAAEDPTAVDAVLNAIRGLEDALATFKLPRRIAFLESLPVNASGKVDRRETARRAEPHLPLLHPSTSDRLSRMDTLPDAGAESDPPADPPPDADQAPEAGPSPETVEELCERLRAMQEGDASLLCDFARTFFSRVPRQLLRERSMEDLAALTLGAFRFAAAPEDGPVRVQMVNPVDEGWSAPVTVIRTLVSDRPFIVDTIREFLGSEKLPIRQYLYPVLRLERDAAGDLIAAGNEASGERFSLVHCEVQRIAGEERRAWVLEEIGRRLEQVVAVTEDFRAMLDALAETRSKVESHERSAPERGDEHAEILEFLRWLEQGNFIFLGYREYDLTGTASDRALKVRPGSGLGILRQEERSAYASSVPLSEMRPELVSRLTEGPPLIINKTNAESPVHRRSRMDYVGVKKLDDDGRTVGERRFLGLFTSKAYAENAEAIPILRRKLHRILERSGAVEGSHDYKEIITIFNSMPKEDLFQSSAEDLEQEVQAILAHLFAAGVRVLLRPDPLGRGASVIVILPESRFNREVRKRIEEVLAGRLQGSILNFHLARSSADQARLHFYVSAASETLLTTDPEELELEISHMIRSWEDRLMDALTSAYGQDEGQRLWDLYTPAFGEEYRVGFLPAAALADIEQLEAMRVADRSVAMAFTAPRGRGRADDFQKVTILKLYLRDQRMVLSDFMPILENAGLSVVELAPFVLDGPGLPRFMIYSFAVRGPDGAPLSSDRTGILAEALLAVRAGDAPDDLFNSLILAAGLRWREVDLLRTYASFAFQADAVPSRLSPARALLRHPEIAQLLVAIVGARFDPAPDLEYPEGLPSGNTTDALRGAIAGALEGVTSLADDRAIRRLLNLVFATTRTNYFRHGGADPTHRSGGAPYISIKIRCADVEELRRSRLRYEIFVHSSRMEGIHLRGAAVSRGGIRWSDRPDDFRTEVLGLVQTQVVKNAVIVPGGSKGGFITRLQSGTRDELLADAAEQYRTLIRGMLDITDNIVDGRVVPPPDVVRHDEDDPYLVVAADKGTAHLSDTANEVAAEYGFWLGDAFASGGSHGYDHKKEGITACGAWECVKRHFWELDKDIQEEPFTVAGIGDMSGDVFGNGMLLSRRIRLIAAFDHRHIFLDPDPDPEVSYVERERLFQMSRSTWDDYDRSMLSAGGMIVPRSSKEVTVTPEVRTALGAENLPEQLDGEALVRAVLAAPVELLWNGGIGTYVKAPDETHGEVGDAANDPVRINADQLRCKVVGEGGNLGFTQRARIQFALTGGRINTDALDNSAGVDMSDHEVNLKILLNPVLSAGEISLDERNRLLARMTEDVKERVLRNSRGQSLAVSLDERRSREALQDFAALITAFERQRLLERGSEGLPSADTLRERAESGVGLTRPALSVLLAYAKLQAKSSILESTLPDDPALFRRLREYFPHDAVTAAGDDRLAEHRLRREIIVTELINDLVNLMGSSFLHRAARDTGADLSAVIRAWVIASGVSGAHDIRRDLALVRNRFSSRVVYRWLEGLARVLERTTHWALANVDPDAPAVMVIEEQKEGLARLRAEFSGLVAGEDRALFIARLGELEDAGVEHALAQRLITLRFLPQLLDILRIAHEGDHDPVETARAYYLISERFGCAALRAALRTAGQEERWDKRFAEGLIEDLGRAHRRLARSVLACLPRAGNTEACLGEIHEARPREVAAYREVLEELDSADDATLAGYAVAIRLLRDIARS